MIDYSEISSKFKKAVVGSYVMDSLTQTEKRFPQLYRFLGIVSEERPEDYPKEFSWNISRIKMENVRTGEIITESADDRYGYYPFVTSSKVSEIVDRQNSLEKDLERYRYILNLIEWNIL